MKGGRKADLLLRERLELTEDLFVEMVIWRVPDNVRGSGHDFKYRLALIENGVCILRYDNEAGKGDHKHFGAEETPYSFRGLGGLQEDFWNDVELRLKQ